MNNHKGKYWLIYLKSLEAELASGSNVDAGPQWMSSGVSFVCRFWLSLFCAGSILRHQVMAGELLANWKVYPARFKCTENAVFSYNSPCRWHQLDHVPVLKIVIAVNLWNSNLGQLWIEVWGKQPHKCIETRLKNGVISPEGNRSTVYRKWMYERWQNKTNKTDVLSSPLYNITPDMGPTATLLPLLAWMFAVKSESRYL